ncbi:MAG: choice-of-anchor D domain-containing protein [Desulfurococcaceae archaeon]
MSIKRRENMKRAYASVALLLTLNLFAFSAPQIRIFPSSPYDFRVVTIDSQSETEFAITNVGDAVLRICSVNIDSGFPDFQLVNNNCNSTSLNYAQDCRFKVRFSPRFKQNYSGTVSVVYDDDGDDLICNTQKTYTLQLTGSGTALRIVKVEPPPLERGFDFDFPATDYYQQRSMTIRICNASGDPLRFSSLAITLSPDSPDYSSFGIAASTCNSATLQYATDNEDCSKNFCQFTVSFSPQAGIGGPEKELYYGYIRVNDLNGGPGGGPSNATIYVKGMSQLGSYIYAPVGSETQEAVRVTFTCPDDPNTTTQTTIFQIGQPSVTGTYFSLVSHSCPNTCIENTLVDCTAIVKFAPQTPGVFHGSVIIPVIGAGSVGRSFLGVAGSLTGNYIYVSPNYIDLGAVRRLNTYAQTLIIRNTSGSELEFNVFTAGSGLTLKSINCTCNTGYVGSPTGICVPNYTIVPPLAPPTEPISNRAYRLRPGEVCSAVVEFTPPIVSSMNSFNGAVIIDTQAQAVIVPLSARMDVPPPPVSQPAPSIGSGGGGGCSTGGANILWLSLLPILVLVRRFIRR